MKRSVPLVLAALLTGSAVAAPAPAVGAEAGEVAVSLRGSRASMLRQNRIAKQLEYSFLRTPSQVNRFVSNGYLVPLPGNEDYQVIAGYPYARPVVRAFIEHLAADFRAACGDRLVVTSLTRPAARQPGNASPLSVHPAGMAVDLRIPANPECLQWLSDELLSLEDAGLLDATREYRPPHFHVAVFPSEYDVYARQRQAEADAAEAIRLLEAAVAAREAEQAMEAERMHATTLAVAVAEPPLMVRVLATFAQLFLPVTV